MNLTPEQHWFREIAIHLLIGGLGVFSLNEEEQAKLGEEHFNQHGAPPGLRPRPRFSQPPPPPAEPFAPITAPPAIINNLVAITTHYNPCGYERPRRNYERFAVGIAAADVPLWTIELAYDDDRFELPAGPRTVRVRGSRERNLMWQKERLLNLLIAKLPDKIDAIAWLDADVVFLNPNWAEELKEVLSRHQAAQLFEDVLHLHDTGKIEPLATGVGRTYQYSRIAANDPNTAHPGFAWAARAGWLRRHGLQDTMVAGGGDCLIASAFLIDSQLIARFINDKWKADIGDWADRVKAEVQGSLHYVSGSLLHLYHGSFENRRYVQRWRYLTDHHFDPRTDLQADSNGLWKWSDAAIANKPEMITAIKGYFAERREDD